MDLHVVVVGELAAEHTVADLTCDPLCVPLLCRPVGHLLVIQQVTLNVKDLVTSGLIFSCDEFFLPILPGGAS